MYRITDRFSSTSLFLLVAFWCAAADAQMLVHFDLPAQPLAQSLKAIGTATNTDVGFNASQVAGLLAPPLKASLTVDGALERVLAGTGLRPRHLDDHTIVIGSSESLTASSAETKQLAAKSSAPPGQSADFLRTVNAVDIPPSLILAQISSTVPKEAKKSEDTGVRSASDQLQEITVTGSHIRGEAPAGSELRVYSREEIDQSGAATMDQFARLVPQNFSNNDSVANFGSPIAGLAPFSGGGNNITGSAAFNLHGLGPSATLTLLNGHRVASAGSDGSLIDISQIPLSAVDHIEVLSDGAAAIYGADAVAGVVNIVTRKDFDGAETGLRYGGATDGGAHEITVSQLFGHSWDTGNALLTYEYDKQGGLDASERSYVPSQGGPYSLVPENRRNSVVVSGSQALGASTTISADAIYSDRVTSYDTTFTSPSSIFYRYTSDEKQTGITLSVEHRLDHDWRVSLAGSYSKSQQDWSQLDSPSGESAKTLFQTLDTDSVLREVDALASGSLVSIPGGPIKAALGGSFRTEQFAESNIVEPSTNNGIPASQRHVSSTFAEVAVPLASESNGILGMRRLDLSAAVRYDDYSDAGSTTNYKLGAAWAPVVWLTFKSTFGTSFRAPLLSQLHELVSSYAFPFPDAASATGTTDTLFELGGNPALKPEKSRSLTIGLDVKTTEHPNFQLSANYFRINFDDRIENPPVIGNTIFTTLLSPFITRNPALAAVQAAFNSPGFLFDFGGPGFTPAGAAAVGAIFDDRVANIATTKESGLDLSTSYRQPTEYGQFGISLDLTHLFRNDFQSINGVPSFALLNVVGEPSKWKGRAGVSWMQGPLTASAFINVVNAYENNLLIPEQSINAWTTCDLYLGYKTHGYEGSPLMRNLTVALIVSNVADRRPPFVALPARQPPIPFDAANASPVGRLVMLQLIKGWKRR